MALQLGEYVVYGELRNTSRNSVFGWLGLNGMDHQISFELTGNCEDDLAGKHVRFRARAIPESAFDEKTVPHFQIRHIGPVGKMTAALKVRVDAKGEMVPPDVSDDPEFDVWKPLFHLEWFGQNGRTVVQMVDPVIQFVKPEEDTEEQADAFFSALFSEAGEPLPEEKAGFDPSASDPDSVWGGTDFEDFRATAEQEEEVAAAMQETELMDDLLESDEGESLIGLLDGATALPDPDSLDENQAAYVLRFVLARLATYGVAIHMCEHVTALDTYRLFIEHMSPDAHCFRELKGTGWVQNFMTSEYCPVCEAEFEREWQDRQDSQNG